MKNLYKMLFPAYEILYIIVHFIYSVVEISQDFYNVLMKVFFNFRHEFSASEQCLKSVHSKARKLNKIPTHLTILLGQEYLSASDFANLVVWSLAAGISFITFYDCKGVLQQKEDYLRKFVEQKIKDSGHVVWHSSYETYKNGLKGNKLHVKLLADDNRGSVVDTCKDLILSEKEDICLDLIDKNLRKYYHFPDPDLGIYYGKIFSLYGYSPWQIRITDFLNAHTTSITSECFCYMLQKYSKCERRLGK